MPSSSYENERNKETDKVEDGRERKQGLHREEEDHEQNGVDATAIALPHASEAGLPTDVPQFDGHISFGDFSHIKPNSGDSVVCEITSLLLKIQKRNTSIFHRECFRNVCLPLKRSPRSFSRSFVNPPESTPFLASKIKTEAIQLLTEAHPFR
jgi:hypothetical protein